MPLWGAVDSSEAKPKFLTDAEKDETFANDSGWVTEAGSARTGNGNTSAQPEVLVCIRNLATKLGAGTITDIEFVTTSFDVSDGGNIDVLVRWNEAVTVSSGTPQVTVTNDQNGGGSDATFTADYLSGSGTNELTFRKTYAGADGGIAATDELSIGANSLGLNSAVLISPSTETLGIEDGTDTTGGAIVLDTAADEGDNVLLDGGVEITHSAGIGTAAGTITAVA